MIKHYMDASVSDSPLELDSDIQDLGALERALSSADVFQPVPRYVKTLRQLRKASQTISCHRDEIKFGVTFGERLKELGDDFGLSPEHFSVNTSGSPLLVKEQVGEHLISPTYFENGAYFSHPHADRQLDHSAQELPSINSDWLMIYRDSPKRETPTLPAQLSVYQDLFHLQGEVEFDGASFMLMKKI